ncbi:Pirin-related protein [Spongiibacter sp. IMCC21906]|uniref:pirin family protein n=1 Tax=Spongiibacter sp. IMCC21906 TaxID=1620392 RepID=UPI00062DEA37|nr:pirin family protein [Spongiibacter sp. IMCC21906]AKH68158.1 Pirin-related protein [Spongiibacter sp. IMCC21906]
MPARQVKQLIRAIDTSDGAGVKLRRSLGQSAGARLDPLLMLDEFYSDEPADYLAGFPSHPHRGFETVTYILDGHMLHEDHLGNKGDLKSGGVQWMRAGRGIIHSEMPQQNQGRMRGFQLWINLPATEKMQAPWYRDLPADQIPHYPTPHGGEIKLIAGELTLANKLLSGALTQHEGKTLSTAPIYADLRLAAGETLQLATPAHHNAVIYVYEGEATIGSKLVPEAHAAVLGEGDTLELSARQGAVQALFIAGRPINEPIVQYGPFVMNSSEEIEQTLQDYRDGRLALP